MTSEYHLQQFAPACGRYIDVREGQNKNNELPLILGFHETFLTVAFFVSQIRLRTRQFVGDER